MHTRPISHVHAGPGPCKAAAQGLFLRQQGSERRYQEVFPRMLMAPRLRMFTILYLLNRYRNS